MSNKAAPFGMLLILGCMVAGGRYPGLPEANSTKKGARIGTLPCRGDYILHAGPPTSWVNSLASTLLQVYNPSRHLPTATSIGWSRPVLDHKLPLSCSP